MANRILAGMFLVLISIFCTAVAIAVANSRRKKETR